VHAQTQLQTIYSARFRGALLEPADQALDRAIERLNAQAPPERTASYVDLIASRMKMQQAALAGQLGQADVPQPPAPSFNPLADALPPLAGADRARDMSADYAAYVEWQPDPKATEQELAADKQRIRSILTREGIGLRWLTDWANLQTELPEIAGRDFWGPELDAIRTVKLRLGRAFTPEGAAAINQFLADIEAANQGDEVFAARRAEYQAAYRNQYFKAWAEFLADFHQGAQAFTGREQRIQLAARLASRDSPYRRVLEVAEAALVPALELAEKPEHIPDWVTLLGRYQRLNDPDYQKQLGGAPGAFDKIIGKAGKVGKAVKFALKSQKEEQRELELDQKALTHLQSYYDTLKKTAENVNAPQAAFQLSKEIALEVDAVIGEPKQPLTRNFWDQGKLKEYLGRGTSAELVFWQFLARPGEQIWSVLLREGETHVQKAWASDVLAQGLGLSGWELVDALQGFGGKVWEFQKANLDPFLRSSPGRGYEPRVIFGSAMSFTSGFLGLLNRGRVGKDAISKTYSVQIGALPTDANVDALRKPQETRLIVQCGTGNQELVNYNFPAKKVIQWSPQNCADVVIEVYVGDTVLKFSYPGYRGFINFLRDLSSGRKVLLASNFPDQAGVLAGYKVRTITLAYTFSGADGVLRLAAADPSSVPERIVGGGE
jgi:type VI secretion system protein ImpL